MKCISCGNELPEGTTSCPFCGNTVLPTNNNVVNENAQNNNGVPVTPEAPVLPQDQNLNEQNNVMSSNGVMNQGMAVTQETSQNLSNQSMNVPDNQNLENQMGGVQDNFSNQTVPATPNSPLVQEANMVSPQVEQGASENSQGAAMQGAFVPPMSDMSMGTMGPQTITNQGEIGDGVKIASTAAPVIENKKNKKVIIIVAVILAIIAIAAGIGVYYYMSQYKSADKRIDAVFSGMNKFAAGLKAEKVETKSGTYDIGLSLSYGDTSFEGNLDGKYAYDLEKRIMDYTLNITKLNMKADGENLELIDKDPLKLELYTAESKAYFLLENFYENYIYSDIEGYDSLFDGIEQNDINYTLILQGYINAIKAGLKAASNTQTVKEVTLDGKTQKANVVTIILNKENKKIIVEKAVNTMKNNTKFLEEFAKLSNMSVDEIKTNIDEAMSDLEYGEGSQTLEIITNTKGTTLLGMRVYDDEANLELAKVVNGYKLAFKKDNKDVFNIVYTSTSTTNSTAKETNQKIEVTSYDEENNLLKANFEINVKDDINPKVEKINTKNSVNYNNISAEDQQKILNNIYNFGNLGLLIQSSMGGMVTPSTPNPYDSTISPSGTVTPSTGYGSTITTPGL